MVSIFAQKKESIPRLGPTTAFGGRVRNEQRNCKEERGGRENSAGGARIPGATEGEKVVSKPAEGGRAPKISFSGVGIADALSATGREKKTGRGVIQGYPHPP